MRPAIANITVQSGETRATFHELASLQQALQSTRAAMVEELSAMKLACVLHADPDEKLLANLQARLERVASLCRQCLDIQQRRQELLGEHKLAPAAV